METTISNGKEVTVEDLDATAQRTDEQLDLMGWKMDKELMVPAHEQDLIVRNLLKSVSEVRQDYHQLKRELVEVQVLQRQLSARLRDQLAIVHGKFVTLRQRLAQVQAPPPP